MKLLKTILGAFFLLICVYGFAGTTENPSDMLRLTSDVSIGNYKYNGVVEAEIESGWDMFTDKGRITFPRQVEWEGRELATGEDPLLRVGNFVELNFGYDDANDAIFKGYVSKIHATIPVEVEVQDAMWLYKRKAMTKSYESTTLKNILSDFTDNSVPIVAPDIVLGQLRFSNVTAVGVMDYLKKNLGLLSWFREGTLYAGLKYRSEQSQEHQIKFERNIIDHDLQYQRAEDVPIQIKIVSILPNNEKIELFEPEDKSDADLRTLHVFDMKEPEMRHFAKQQASSFIFTGYRGSFTTFLQPKVRHGDVIALSSDEYPERNGRYHVKKVTTQFGVNGGRQIVELDDKV